jgi:hypothetical protein
MCHFIPVELSMELRFEASYCRERGPVTPEQGLEAAIEINWLWIRHISYGEESPDVVTVARVIERYELSHPNNKASQKAAEMPPNPHTRNR